MTMTIRSRPYLRAACRSWAALDAAMLYEKATPLYPSAFARGKRAIMRSTSFGSLISRHTKSQRFCRPGCDLAAVGLEVGFGAAHAPPKRSALISKTSSPLSAVRRGIMPYLPEGGIGTERPVPVA